MAKLRVCTFGVSLDGYGAGPGQCLEHPLGLGGEAVHAWAFATRSFHEMQGLAGGESGVDDDMFASGFANIGSFIMGRNMFGPARGPWGGDPWRGWWGEDPPFHVPVFVLTRHARDPLIMDGGTVFHFVTEGIEVALQRALGAAAGRDVRLGGGVATIKQYLAAGLIDELHLSFAGALLGRGESLFQGLDAAALGYGCRRTIAGERATHVFLSREIQAVPPEPKTRIRLLPG
jgi:dihydrofolate reductase